LSEKTGGSCTLAAKAEKEKTKINNEMYELYFFI